MPWERSTGGGGEGRKKVIVCGNPVVVHDVGCAWSLQLRCCGVQGWSGGCSCPLQWGGRRRMLRAVLTAAWESPACLGLSLNFLPWDGCSALDAGCLGDESAC